MNIELTTTDAPTLSGIRAAMGVNDINGKLPIAQLPDEIDAILVPVKGEPAVIDEYIGTDGEFTSDGERIRLMDGTTPGGIKMARVDETVATFPITLIINSDNTISGYFLTQIEDTFKHGNTTIKGLYLGTMVTEIGNFAFNSCTGLTGPLIIPRSVTTIKSGAFGNCSGLTGILDIPDNVTSISNSFYGCTSFTGLKLGVGITSIGANAFSNCTNMGGDLILPKGFTTFAGEGQFDYTKFSTVTFPSSFTTFAGHGSTFDYCPLLTTVYCYCNNVFTQDIFYGSALTTVHARANDNTWTAGVQTFSGKENVNVIKDL